MSHATLLETLDTGAIWSVARGLARNVEDYKQKLANCDLERRTTLTEGGTSAKKRSRSSLGSFWTLAWIRLALWNG
jgi:hypothetical protein